MAPIRYPSFDVPWGGKSHTVTVNFDLIDHIEQEVDLLSLSESYGKRRYHLSTTAKVVATALGSAGCTASKEDVWNEMRRSLEVKRAMVAACSEILVAALTDLDPEETPGNAEAPKSGANTPSGGRSSTKSQSGTSGSSQANSGG